MANAAIITGALLIVQGLFGYLGADADHRSPTALIPLFFGVPISLCGVIALKESLKKHAMHGAVGIATLGALAAWGRGIPGLIKLAQGDEGTNQRAVTMVIIMAIICTIFMILCIRSFIAARKRQAQQDAPNESTEETA